LGDGLEDDGDNNGDDGMALSQDWCQHHLDLRPGVAETLLSMLSLSPHHAIELLPSVILTAGSVNLNGVRTCVCLWFSFVTLPSFHPAFSSSVCASADAADGCWALMVLVAVVLVTVLLVLVLVLAVSIGVFHQAHTHATIVFINLNPDFKLPSALRTKQRLEALASTNAILRAVLDPRASISVGAGTGSSGDRGGDEGGGYKCEEREVDLLKVCRLVNQHVGGGTGGGGGGGGGGACDGDAGLRSSSCGGLSLSEVRCELQRLQRSGDIRFTLHHYCFRFVGSRVWSRLAGWVAGWAAGFCLLAVFTWTWREHGVVLHSRTVAPHACLYHTF
jgi:hypothetical protein